MFVGSGGFDQSFGGYGCQKLIGRDCGGQTSDYILKKKVSRCCEPVWPSGKALGW